jgi:hypothetical protein
MPYTLTAPVGHQNIATEQNQGLKDARRFDELGGAVAIF